MHDESKLARRNFFRSAATLTGAALVAAVIPVRELRAQQKLSKSSMQYQDTPKNGQRCDECVYFKPPDACGLVEGKISPQGWCVAYNKKKS